MQEELSQFTKNDVWDLVPRPKRKHVTGTKWVSEKKLSEQGDVVRNNPCWLKKGYNRQEVIDYVETFALVARLESIHLLIAYAVIYEIVLY